MWAWTIAVCCGLLGFAVYNTMLLLVFVVLLARHSRRSASGEYLPRATIVLALRGADPVLGENLRRMMTQDYPDYEIKIVIDREDDPAWEVVQEAIDQTGFQNVSVEPHTKRPKTCSLKNSAQIQALEELDKSCEVVVLAIGDTLCYENWLRELVAPLSNPRVGAAFGNRWNWPENATWGSLVRYLWNAVAVVSMYFCRIPWGGSLAIRASVFHNEKLLDRWARAMADDAPLRTVLKMQRLKIEFVPSVMMVNREDCDLRFCLDFVTRQLFWTRLYHPGWTLVVAYTFALLILPVIAIGTAIYAAAIGQTAQAAWVCGSIAACWMLLWLSLMWLEYCVRQVIVVRGESPGRRDTGFWIKAAGAIPLALLLHFAAVVSATFKRRVDWRGTTYRVNSPWDIHIEDYQPFHRCHSSESNVSL